MHFVRPFAALAALCAVGAALSVVGAAPASAQAKPQVAGFRISGVALEMPVPAGYCLPTGKWTDVAQLMAAADKDNVTDLTLFACPGDGGNDYILVKTPTKVLMVDTGREEALKELATAFDTPELKAEFSSGKLMTDAGKGISDAFGHKVDLAGEIKPLGRDEACVYLGGSTEVKAPNVSYRISVGGCISVVGRRMLSVFLYGPDKGPAGVAALVVRSRRLMETIRVAPAG
jgi:hypothetical protein